MKKIFLILALALTVSVANAWNKSVDEGVVVLASKHLTAEAKSMLTQYLGESYTDDVQYLSDLERNKKAKHTKEIHNLHLGRDLRPVKVEGDDALAALEQALSVVRARNSHSKAEVVTALRTAIELVCDIHNLSHVRIEGVAHSSEDFRFTVYAGDIGKRKTTSKIRWYTFWNNYSGWHTGFSGNLWAEDLELNLGAQRESMIKGSLQDWVMETGATTFKLLSRINPEYSMTRRERNELEVLNCAMIARAGYRLAVLLNEAAK